MRRIIKVALNSDQKKEKARLRDPKKELPLAFKHVT